MGEQRKSISEAYSETAYPLIGHSRRNLEVLLEAFRDVDGSQMGDTYGKGAIIEEFQARMADVLGKESAVFFRAEPWRSRLLCGSGAMMLG